MRNFILIASLLAACGARQHGRIDGGVLGRVVIYRNGVAFYERRATVEDGQLVVRVPRERVDDFLKSLTVVDPRTRKPLSVTIPRRDATGDQLTMTLETGDARHADVLLTYVTEAPSWKPSYRVVVGADGKVMLESWAVVDNTTSEDWNGVLVGVGASSALAFRYDLWSVRQIDRDLLQNEERFAIAPPTGVSPYGGAPAEELVSFAGDASIENMAGEMITVKDSAPMIDATSTSQSVTITHGTTRNAAAGRTLDDFGGFDGPPPRSHDEPAPPPRPDPAAELRAQIDPIVAAYRKDKRHIVVESYGPASAAADATRRGESYKHKLVDAGIPAENIHVVTRPADTFSTKVLAVAAAPVAPPAAKVRDLGPDAPVGESHFIADRPMTVRAGSSAMVAMVHQETTGGVVYLYDPISERGDTRFAFKAVRLDNPTPDTLEPGPVTVYGDGRFIGEGITEPVPPHASVVVPFALDKQIVISDDLSEQDRIAKLVTVQRGVLTADLQHRRSARYTVTSRLDVPATVYLRHRLESGWTLVDAPSAFTRVGDSQLFELRLGPGETKAVTISEATPVQRTFQLGAPEVLGMMRVYIDEPDASPQLRGQIEALLATHRAAADLDDKIATLRDQLGEYRARAGELHTQVITLKAVRTGGDLLAALKTKLAETSDRIQQTTIAIVDTQEQLMLTRVKFQNQLADLRL